MREYASPERCVPSEIANPPGRYILRATMDAERDTELSKMVAVGDILRGGRTLVTCMDPKKIQQASSLN